MPTRSSAASTRVLRSAGGHAAVGQRQLDVLVDREVADQVEAWKMKPICRLRMSARCAATGPRPARRPAGSAARRRVEQAQDREQRGLARARRARRSRRTRPCWISRCTSGQRVGLDLVGVENLAHALELDERLVHVVLLLLRLAASRLSCGGLPLFCPKPWVTELAARLLQSNAIDVVPLRLRNSSSGAGRRLGLAVRAPAASARASPAHCRDRLLSDRRSRCRRLLKLDIGMAMVVLIVRSSLVFPPGLASPVGVAAGRGRRHQRRRGVFLNPGCGEPARQPLPRSARLGHPRTAGRARCCRSTGRRFGSTRRALGRDGWCWLRRAGRNPRLRARRAIACLLDAGGAVGLPRA